MAKKGCELCHKPARMFCESDQASLCWICDEKVHAANFLVAKHSRNLLCHVCHLPTPWKADGPRLAPTLSVCHACASSRRQNREASSSATSRPDNNEDGQVEVGFVSRDDESDDDGEGEDYSDSDYYYDTEEEEEEEDDDENQVVPWSNSSTRPPSPSVSSSSIDGDVSLSGSSKRIRGSTCDSEDEEGCCSSQNHGIKLGSSSSSSSSSKLGFRDGYCLSVSSLLRPSKLPRTSDDGDVLNRL